MYDMHPDCHRHVSIGGYRGVAMALAENPSENSADQFFDGLVRYT